MVARAAVDTLPDLTALPAVTGAHSAVIMRNKLKSWGGQLRLLYQVVAVTRRRGHNESRIMAVCAPAGQRNSKSCRLGRILVRQAAHLANWEQRSALAGSSAVTLKYVKARTPSCHACFSAGPVPQ